ncbi:MAG: succinate dehydrogenase/fumarate reductase transmembrane subunit [Deferrisomatales bacterium]
MAQGSVCCTQFWLRKLHSLTGFVFLGYFVCLHVRGGFPYASPVLKSLFLWAPLVFHGGYGAYITYESLPNLWRYPWVRNWMYFGQRATGLYLIPFLLLHLGAVRWGAGYAEAGWYTAVWYAGVLAAVFHLANGLFGTLIDWGVTAGPHSQKVFVGVSFAAFLILSAYGLYTLAQF